MNRENGSKIIENNVLGFSRAELLLAPNGGEVGAGKSVIPFPNSDKVFIPRPEGFRAGDKLIRITVSGDSLKGDGINTGDYLTCRQNFDFAELQDGSLVVVNLPGNDLLIRHIYINDDAVTLKASNPEYEDKNYRLSEIEIHALVLEHIRNARYLR